MTCKKNSRNSFKKRNYHLVRFWLSVEHLETLSAFIITCVGSLTKAVMRLADSTTLKTFEGLDFQVRVWPPVASPVSGHSMDGGIRVKGNFEIVSLVGTLDPDGQHHLHISISDSSGATFGGHVWSDHIIYTTGRTFILWHSKLNIVRILVLL